ncbi:hypothetical protein, partial [Pseudomonas brenneri]|uniref:hypothetical protein n=1 Tax=Pseudomonas brenneri TaxID=129817 RepID=UPI003BA353A5
ISMLITLCSPARKSEQKQLNTWVSFQSAEQPLLGQFSVSGNSQEATLGFGRFPKQSFITSNKLIKHKG